MAVAAFLGGRASVDPTPAPREEAQAPAPTASAVPSATPGTSTVEGDGTLDLGVTEPNPALFGGPGPAAVTRWAPLLTKQIRPTFYRLVVEWDKLAAPDGSGFDVAQPQTGCQREVAPCAPYDGIRAQLAQVKAMQAANPGRFRLMVTFMYTPSQLARPASGCERAGTGARSRAPREDALPTYRATIKAVLDEANRQGVEIAYWNPWNEPNHPYFISPQRTACSGSAPSASTGPYVQLATAMRDELQADGATGKMVLGETAAFLERRPNATTVGELIAALPRDMVCSAAAYGQHAYLGGTDPVNAVARALAKKDCDTTPPIWITETGADVGRSDEVSACRAVHRRLVRWYRDPRVTAAFQYTVRQDESYPTGLLKTDLSGAFPVAKEWEAWGARRDAATEPPPDSCGP